MITKIVSLVGARQGAVHLVGVLVAGLVFGAFYAWGYARSSGDMAASSERIEQLRRLLANGTSIAQDHKQVVAELDKLRTTVKTTSDRMPAPAAAPKFVEQSRELAIKAGMEVLECKMAPPQGEDAQMVVEVSYQLRGSFAGACQFLAAVDHLPQLSKVSRLELASPAESSTYPLQITFQLYCRANPHDKEIMRGTP